MLKCAKVSLIWVGERERETHTHKWDREIPIIERCWSCQYFLLFVLVCSFAVFVCVKIKGGRKTHGSSVPNCVVLLRYLSIPKHKMTSVLGLRRKNVSYVF